MSTANSSRWRALPTTLAGARTALPEKSLPPLAHLSRAYGLDPNRGVNFVAGMDRIDPRLNKKELAASIANAIADTQGYATPGEVMQALQGVAAQQKSAIPALRILTASGMPYSSLLGNEGMAADHASSILGAANGSMQQMDGSEAARNFTLRAFGGLVTICLHDL